MKLYYSPQACSLSPRIALHKAGIAHTDVLANTKTHKLPDGTDYYTINPLGYVPLLEQLEGKQWLMGDTFTVADGYLFTCARWGAFVGVDTSGYKNVTAYLARVQARPAPPCRRR